MAIKTSNYYKLDSNIDGFYIDEKGRVISVNDMVGVVGATDGPAAYPLSVARKAPIIQDDINELENNSLSVTQIKNYNGHGLLYDKKGNQVAQKGQMFFKDGLGNFSTLKDLTNNSTLIQEDQTHFRLKDDSLIKAGYTSKLGITLDYLLNIASLNSVSFSKGNILQLSRNYETNKSLVSIPTISLLPDAVVWIVGRVTSTGSGTVKLVHKNSNTVLDITSYDHPNNFSMPSYISWIGTLPQGSSFTEDISETNTACGSVIWDFKTKSFRKVVYSSTEETFTHVLELVTDKDVNHAYMNIICMEPSIRNSSLVKNGNHVIQKQTELEIEFAEEFTDDLYSISIQIDQPLQTWFTEKTQKGFIINIEREYEGLLSWTALRTK